MSVSNVIGKGIPVIMSYQIEVQSPYKDSGKVKVQVGLWTSHIILFIIKRYSNTPSGISCCTSYINLEYHRFLCYHNMLILQPKTRQYTQFIMVLCHCLVTSYLMKWFFKVSTIPCVF